MNPMYLKIGASLVRYALMAGGFEGLISDDDLTQLLGALTMGGTIIWSVYKNFKERQVLVTALSRSNMNENDATAMVSDPSVMTPSVTTPADEVPV